LDRKNKYSGVLLAAGTSSRMSSWKPAAILNGKPLLFYPLEIMSQVCSEVVVVVGYNIKGLTALINDNEVLFTSKVTCIENKNYESGMFSSVKAGLANTGRDNIFIALADMPFITVDTYNQIIDFSESGPTTADVIYPVVINNVDPNKIKKGHPILITKRVKERILKETGDIILRDVLKEFEGKQCLVTDNGIKFDIDTEEDFERAKNYYSHLKNKIGNIND
jgi:molybdenum cofactor cytidylyltransferase